MKAATARTGKPNSRPYAPRRLPPRRRPGRAGRSVGGHYDVRQRAAGYAPIIATFGALAVPAIIVLFTLPPKPAPQTAPFIALAAGLLILAMIGSFTGAIGMAAIGAEQEPTANLPAAIMFVAVPAALSVIAVLAAFEVLAAIYLPHSKTLFAVIVGVGGMAATFFTAFAIGDSWHTGPADPVERRLWLRTQWLRSHAQAYKWANLAGGIGVIPAVTGILVRILGAGVAPTTSVVNWLVGSGLGLVITGTAFGMLRTSHPVDGVQKSLRPFEAFGTTLAIGLYVLTLMIFLP